MFNADICKTAGDAILDLVSVISTKFNLLLANKTSEPRKSASEILEMTDIERFDETIDELDFNLTMSGLSLFRYITDNIADMPLSVMTMILNENDMICTLVYILEMGPWIRKTPSGLERFESGVWQGISKEDLLLMGKLEGQIWLALMNLLLDQECRRKYNYTTRNQSIVLRVNHIDIAQKLHRRRDCGPVASTCRPAALPRRASDGYSRRH